MKLSGFVNDVEKLYLEERKKYESLSNQLDEVNALLADLEAKRSEYTGEGFESRRGNLIEKKKGIESQFEEIPKEYESRTAAVRQACKKEFSRKYGFDSSMIDNAGLALVQSGLASDDELDEMLEKYASNATMRRFVGNAICRRGEENGNDEQRLRGEAIVQKTMQNEPLSLLDGYILLNKNGIRTHVSGETSAAGVPYELSVEESRGYSDDYHTQLHGENYGKYYELGEGFDSI